MWARGHSATIIWIWFCFPIVMYGFSCVFAGLARYTDVAILSSACEFGVIACYAGRLAAICQFTMFFRAVFVLAILVSAGLAQHSAFPSVA